jgi:hypothetical protein
MPLLTILRYIIFIGGGKPEKTTNLPQITDKLDHIMLYHLSEIQLKMLVVIGNDYIGS